MTKKVKKKCQRVLRRQVLSGQYHELHCWNKPAEVQVHQTKYLVNDQEVSEEEFKQALIASRPCEQSLECVFAGIGGMINGTRFQIKRT